MKLSIGLQNKNKRSFLMRINHPVVSYAEVLVKLKFGPLDKFLNPIKAVIKK
jgi:hypothetical protein